MKGKWIFRHHAPVGCRSTKRDLFFAITNIQHPDGYLFESDGKWILDINGVAASSHLRGPKSLRAFKKYLRKHPELDVYGNVMSLCSRYVGFRSLPVDQQSEGSNGLENYDFHIDAIFVPLSDGFPPVGKTVRAFIRMEDGTYKYDSLYYEDKETKRDFNYYSDTLDIIGEVLYWEHNNAKGYINS